MARALSVILIRWRGPVLMVVGSAIITWSVVEQIRAHTYQQHYAHQFTTAAAELAALQGTPASMPALGESIGLLEVPRLGLSAVVVHGDTDSILKRAVGHLADTSLPWDPGNTALAAHRDTIFRPLERVRVDDILRLTTRRGRFHYRVRQTLVVNPEDVWVLDPTPVPTLTLITCYPFRYVGSAPQRFIVRAERIEHPPQAAQMVE